MYYKILILFLFIPCCKCFADPPDIVLNQLGFHPVAAKIAVVLNAPLSTDFYIISNSKNDTVYRGKLQAPQQSPYSATIARIADFSSINTTGTFTIHVKGLPISRPFVINKNILHNISVASIKAFYYQRSNIALEEKYAGQWKRPAGHPDTSVQIHPSAADKNRPSGFILSSAGGWYDAGDYNKYIVNCGITMSTLLSAYEDFSDYYNSLQLNIPETGNGLPDILNEVLYNLRWMLTMQDINDGGVYHKCTNANFDGNVMPGVTKAPRYVVQKSTAATLDFAAVMAQASRVFNKFRLQLPALSDSCLKAAQFAWQWSNNNPAVVYQQDEMNKQFAPAINTGAYGDNNLADEWFWAAVELSASTGDTRYLENSKVSTPITVAIPSWNKVDMLGVYTALKHKKAFAGSKLNTNALELALTRFADSLIKGSNKAFQCIMGQSAKDFVWGSNAVALNQSMLLIKTFLITNKQQYLRAAASNLDYVTGRNATGYCFVTGFGHTSPMHIHHRPSQADGITAPIPGLLAGGPNPGRQDKCHYSFTDIETSYTDEECSYASNEIAINWNAPLVYVTGAIDFIDGR